jgi:hypothetical protein
VIRRHPGSVEALPLPHAALDIDAIEDHGPLRLNEAADTRSKTWPDGQSRRQSKSLNA